jgi:hypothetical protein
MPHKKTSKHRKTKRRHRGGYYGASGAVVQGGVGPAGMKWGSGEEVPTVEVGGAPIPVNLKGGRKNRKSKKKSTKRRRMRGGTKFGGTFASYEGDGSRGLASVSQGTHTPGAPQLGRFNNHGAGPGNLDSFKGLRPAKF